jgi:hypothetical protein
MRRAATRSKPLPDPKNHFSSGQGYKEERPDEESKHNETA